MFCSMLKSVKRVLRLRYKVSTMLGGVGFQELGAYVVAMD